MRRHVLASAVLGLSACLAFACSQFDSAPGGEGDGDGGAAGSSGDGGAGPDASSPDAGGADGGAADSVLAVRGGGQFACALHALGAVSCWGRNDELQVGISGPGDLAGDQGSHARPDPVRVAGIAAATHLATGFGTACAREATGKVSCWGSNVLGALGQGPNAPSTSATPLALALPPALDVTVGSMNGCARVAVDGGVDVYCWGTNRAGLLGSEPSTTIYPPTVVPALHGAKAVVLSNSFELGCAIREDDTVACWGDNYLGSLGHEVGTLGDITGCLGGSYTCNPVPVAVPALAGSVQLALGLASGCARSAAGEVRCWGADTMGARGQGAGVDQASHPTPALVAGLGPADEIASSAFHVCARVGAKLRCWGGNDSGQLGNGGAGLSCAYGRCATSPQEVMLTGAITGFAVGGAATYAELADGTHWAWGANPDGRLGHAPGTSSDLLACGQNQGRCNPLPQRFAIP